MPSTSPRLWIVATPLGNPGDLSPRAREVIAGADLALADDTRRAAQLCRRCGIEARRFVSFFDHNEIERQAEVIRLLREGRDIALVSDAGTPLLADPGYRLVRACRRQGIPVSPVPGPSAPVAALSAAGLPPLPYTFLGFLPRDAGGRRKLFAAFASVPGTLVFFERRDRLAESLSAAHELLGPRELAVCRELTKIHEEFILGRLEDAASIPNGLLGELTVLIGPPETVTRTPEDAVRSLLREALASGAKPRAAAREVQGRVRGWSGRELYAAIEEMRNAAANGDTVQTEE